MEVFDADVAAARALVGAGDLPAADVIVTSDADTHLAIWAGDCAPVVLCGAGGTLVAVHAGWKGLAGGVLDVAVDVITGRGDRVGAAVLGPCIHAECYEFGPKELHAVAGGIAGGGDPDVAVAAITATTASGRTALDLPAAVAFALRRHDVELDTIGGCTACDPRWFSHRARADVARHAVVAWTHPNPGPKMEQMSRSARHLLHISDGRGGERGVGGGTAGVRACRDRGRRTIVEPSRRRGGGDEGVRTRGDRSGRRGGMSLHRGELRPGTRRQAGRDRTARTARALHRSPAEQQGAPSSRRLVGVWETVDRASIVDRDRPSGHGCAGPGPGERHRRGVEVRLPARGCRRARWTMRGRPDSTSPG